MKKHFFIFLWFGEDVLESNRGTVFKLYEDLMWATENWAQLEIWLHPSE